jgi:hypothetical protein
MRRILAIALMVLALPLFAATEPNPSAKQRELIDELMAVTNMSKLEGQIIDAMLAQFSDQLTAGIPAGEAERLADATRDLDRYRELLHGANIHALTREVYYQVYAKYFTEAELAGLIAFYRTPTGVKAISVMPQMMKEAMEKSAAVLTPKLTSIFAQVERERDLRQPWKKTMSSMRSIGYAIESYAEEHDGHYPEGDFTAMTAALGDEAADLAATDVWGNAFAYIVSPDRTHFRIISAGSDGIFNWDSRRIVPAADDAELQVRYTDRPEEDIVMADNQLIQVPKASQPKEPAKP